MTQQQLTRRQFIAVASAAGGGLLLGFQLPWRDEVFAAATADPVVFVPNAWLRIDASGNVTITVARSELGQGAWTAMPMLVAEELEADWSTIRVEQALADKKYGDMTTGGSSSVRDDWERLRKAGATAREMLVAAAAQAWGVEPAACRAEKGIVIHSLSGRRLAYGELAEAAAQRPVPETVTLKEPQEFRILGQRIPRLDTPIKVEGRAVFGIDVRRPGMLVAAVERPAVIGGKVRRFDATRSLQIPGVRRVLEIPSGVAVLADSTWAALQGRRALQVEWDLGANAGLDSAGLRQSFEVKSREPGVVARQDGDASAALATAAKKIEAVYALPFLAHATLEPMNCTADVRKDEADVWAPTQAPQWAHQAVAGTLELPPERVRLHTTLVGGAFGRRLMFDFVVEAARLSKQAGAPVQVVWTREDDMRHDFYRPASYHRLAAGLNAQGQLVAWSHRLVAPSIMAQTFPEEAQEKPDAVDGAANLPYAIPNLRVDYVMANTPVPVGWWRSVYNSQNAFVNECFLDEIAAAAKTDPYAFRRRLLPKGSRLGRVLEEVARRSEWERRAPSGRARGIACHTSFGSSFAEVAEVSVDATGRVRVHRVTCVLDCGPAVNPDTIEAQVEGAIAYGLSAALRGEITLARGGVVQSNFDDYQVLVFDEMPVVDVHILPSTEPIGGIGEPGLPPLAPAVCNAIHAATGKRVRELPIRPQDLRG